MKSIDTTKLLFNNSVSEFVGLDLKTYGPFLKGEIVEVPSNIAVQLMMVGKNLAEPINKKLITLDGIWELKRMKDNGEDLPDDWKVLVYWWLELKRRAVLMNKKRLRESEDSLEKGKKLIEGLIE